MFGRDTAAQRPVGGGAGRGHAVEHATQVQQLGRLQQRQRAQALQFGVVAFFAAQQGQGFAHLQRVAGRAAEHAVHVGQQGHGGQAGARVLAPCGLHQAARQFTRALQRGHEGAAAHLHVQHQGLQAGRALLAQDAGGDQGYAVHRGRQVADGVQAPVGRGQGVAGADDGAAGGLQRGHQARSAGLAAVAGQGFELVQRAAGVAQAAAADHGHDDACGRPGGSHHGRQDEAELVAHAAGAVLVEHRAAEAAQRGAAPVQHAAGLRHGLGQGRGLGAVHAAPDDGHGQGSGLAVAPGTIHQPADEVLDLCGAQRAAVALAADGFLRQRGHGGHGGHAGAALSSGA